MFRGTKILLCYSHLLYKYASVNVIVITCINIPLLIYEANVDTGKKYLNSTNNRTISANTQSDYQT
jgi:hypothetical protein